MPHADTIARVQDTLIRVFAEVDPWFDRPAIMRSFQPADGGWSIDQVLEHITLTNLFLMRTFGEGRSHGVATIGAGDIIATIASDLDRLTIIGERGSFGWPRPEHMEPTGIPSSDEVRETLRQQRDDCLETLAQMPNGEGTLCRFHMTVNDIGKIDLYQWLHFLSMHAHRHLDQLLSLERESLVGTS